MSQIDCGIGHISLQCIFIEKVEILNGKSKVYFLVIKEGAKRRHDMDYLTHSNRGISIYRIVHSETADSCYCRAVWKIQADCGRGFEFQDSYNR